MFKLNLPSFPTSVSGRGQSVTIGVWQAAGPGGRREGTGCLCISCPKGSVQAPPPSARTVADQVGVAP